LKKILIAALVATGVLLVVLYSQLDAIVETGITSNGPDILAVDVGVENISISPFSGAIGVTGLTIGQPAGFGDGAMFALGDFSMKLETGSLFGNHIIIDSMLVDAALLDVRRQEGKTNFQAFQDGLNLPTDDSTSPPEEDITITIRELIIRAPRILAKNDGFLKLDEDITLADFTLTDLGTDEEGLAPKEIARHIMDTLQPQITKALIAAGASNKVKEIAAGAKGKLEKGFGGLLDKLKKKKKPE